MKWVIQFGYYDGKAKKKIFTLVDLNDNLMCYVCMYYSSMIMTNCNDNFDEKNVNVIFFPTSINTLNRVIIMIMTTTMEKKCTRKLIFLQSSYPVFLLCFVLKFNYHGHYAESYGPLFIDHK